MNMEYEERQDLEAVRIKEILQSITETRMLRSFLYSVSWDAR
jgi:hypothetical protein